MATGYVATRWFVLWALAYSVACTGASAHGQELDERAQAAHTLFDQGRAVYKAGDYDRAQALFEQAYKQKPLPLLLYNIAQAARLGGHFEYAIEEYHRYLIAVPTATERPAIERYLSELTDYVRAHAPPPQTGVAAPVTNTLIVTPPPPRKKRGLAIGLGVGAVVVVGVAVALGVAFGVTRGAPSSALGTYHPYN